MQKLLTMQFVLLKAKAIFEGQTIPLHLKVAWSNDITKTKYIMICQMKKDDV